MLDFLSDITTSSLWANVDAVIDQPDAQYDDDQSDAKYDDDQPDAQYDDEHNETETDGGDYKSFEVPTSSHGEKNRLKATQSYWSWMWWSSWACWLWIPCCLLTGNDILIL